MLRSDEQLNTLLITQVMKGLTIVKRSLCVENVFCVADKVRQPVISVNLIAHKRSLVRRKKKHFTSDFNSSDKREFLLHDVLHKLLFRLDFEFCTRRLGDLRYERNESITWNRMLAC